MARRPWGDRADLGRGLEGSVRFERTMWPFGALSASAPVSRASSFPAHDWQFWVVTGVAILAAAWIVYRLAPRRLFGKRRRHGAKHATLTIGGRPVEPARKDDDCH
jgi:hypothetical protein